MQAATTEEEKQMRETSVRMPGGSAANGQSANREFPQLFVLRTSQLPSTSATSSLLAFLDLLSLVVSKRLLCHNGRRTFTYLLLIGVQLPPAL